MTEYENNSQNNVIVNSIKKAIYNALFHYFDTPPKAALLASLLDPRFKRMHGWPDETKQSAISSLKEEYLLLKNKEVIVIQRNTRPNTFQTGGFKSRLFGFDEIDDVNNGKYGIVLHAYLMQIY